MSQEINKPPLEVTDEMREKWSREAREWASSLRREVDSVLGVPAQGWCKSCDRDEPHEHIFSISK